MNGNTTNKPYTIMDEIRLLTKDDIDVRVAQTTNYEGKVKVSLLLYKDARVDMKILDELYTPMGWKRTHRLIGDRLYCLVEVWDKEKKEWVGKEDVGTESNTEAEKGQASDSFKRACFNWGIGRELYTAPKITVELNEKEYTRDNNSKIRVYATFSVKSIGYDEKTRTISSLEIQDRFGNIRFTMGGQSVPKETPQVVKTRRQVTGRGETEVESVPYTPVSPSQYWSIVKAYAEGRKTKDGGDYRETWAKKTHARTEHILQFDKDVDNYRRGETTN